MAEHWMSVGGEHWTRVVERVGRGWNVGEG